MLLTLYLRKIIVVERLQLEIQGSNPGRRQSRAVPFELEKGKRGHRGEIIIEEQSIGSVNNWTWVAGRGSCS